MAFTPTTWTDGTTAITATELNRIEAGIEDAHAGDIDAGAIGADELASDAVTEAKILAGAVTTNKLVTASSTTTGVTDAKLRYSSAVSVIGRSAGTVGAPDDIIAGSDGFVLRRSGTTLEFGTVAEAGIADAAVTPAKASFYPQGGAVGGIFAFTVDSSGTANALTGWTITRTGAGAYNVAHPLASTAYTVVATPEHFAADARFVSLASVGSSSFAYVTRNSAGTVTDTGVHLLILSRA